jgi:glucosamine--fructose-6-phosphate aminotransferase (isomerizing)
MPVAAESLMLREAREAPAVVARALAANARRCRELAGRLRERQPPFAITCARGSSDHAATYAKYLAETRLGLVTASIGPSVSSIYGAPLRAKGALFLAISQSGRSPDLVQLAETARAEGALTVALVNDAASPLAAACEIVLPLHAGPERSVAATKSLLAAMATVLQIVAAWRGDTAMTHALETLPADLAAAARTDWSAALPVLRDASHLYVVARGIGLAAAQEAALKLKEAAGLHAEALSAAELMHGPLALAGPGFPVLLFAQRDAAEPGLAALARDLSDRRVPLITAGLGAAFGAGRLPVAAGVDPHATPLLLLQSFYPLADAVARARGRDPDRPPHLRKVTETL